MAKLPWAGFEAAHEGGKAKPEVWKEQAKFKELATKLEAETGKLAAAAKTGDLDKVKAAVGLENLMDKTGKEYERRNLAYLIHDPVEMLLRFPLLLRTPVVRDGNRATVGYQPEVWREWQ